MLTLNDFFCGCGGLGLGFKQAGFEIVGAWDNDKFAVKTYAANIGRHVRLADVSQLTYNNLPAAQVWALGFPCQSISLAGKKAGIRVICVECGTESHANSSAFSCPHCGKSKFRGANNSGMFYEIMRLLDETALHAAGSLPSILLVENVKGLRPYLPMLELEYALRGYKMYPIVYNSKYWGVPQSRERYFVVGTRHPQPFSFLPQQTQYIPKLSDILPKNSAVQDKYYSSDEMRDKLVDAGKKKLRLADEVSPTAAELQTSFVDKDGCAYCLTAMYHKGIYYTDIARNQRTGVFEDAVPPHSGKVRARRLTPEECGRLQGFPMDSWKTVVSDTQAYKQFGNAVTVTVAKGVAMAIKGYLESL